MVATGQGNLTAAIGHQAAGILVDESAWPLGANHLAGYGEVN